MHKAGEKSTLVHTSFQINVIKLVIHTKLENVYDVGYIAYTSLALSKVMVSLVQGRLTFGETNAL